MDATVVRDPLKLLIEVARMDVEGHRGLEDLDVVDGHESLGVACFDLTGVHLGDGRRAPPGPARSEPAQGEVAVSD